VPRSRLVITRILPDIHHFPGFGEITFLQYSSYFSKNTVSAWSSGTGGAGILGSLSYLGLRYALDTKWTLIVCR
jgi:battenin